MLGHELSKLFEIQNQLIICNKNCDSSILQQYQSVVIMLQGSELNFSNSREKDKTIKKYILIRESLDRNFNPDQWRQIIKHSPSTHKRIQNKIKEHLISNEDLFSKYFSLFYENNVKIYHWYLLARENHHLMKMYLSKELLSKTIDNYQHEMKQFQIKNLKEKQKQKQNKVRQKSKQQARMYQSAKPYKIDDLTNEIFKFMATKALTASLIVWQKPWSRNKRQPRQESESSIKQISSATRSPAYQKSKTSSPKNKKQLAGLINTKFLKNHDFHDLYIQTFHACDGPRYIFYNYEKHMKGLNQKDKYNMFIRAQNKGKFADLRLTEQSQEEPVVKQIKSCDVNRFKSSFQYSTYGNAVSEGRKKSSKVVLKRNKMGSCGKFIRRG